MSVKKTHVKTQKGELTNVISEPDRNDELYRKRCTPDDELLKTGDTKYKTKYKNAITTVT